MSSFQKIRPEEIDNVHNILNLDKYNGRVNVIEPQNPDVVIKMQERIATKNKATSYREALNGTWEDNLLAQVFFSAKNVQILQNGVRAGVYKMSGNRFVIAPPSVDTLKIIMRSTYLQYAEHYPDKITEQVQRLNDIVLDYAVNDAFSGASAYVRYLQDQSTLVVPLDLPLNHDRQYKQLELKQWF